MLSSWECYMPSCLGMTWMRVAAPEENPETLYQGWTAREALTCGGLLAGAGVPGSAGKLHPADALHGVLGVAEPAQGPDKANFDVLDAQVEAGQQDGGGNIACRQHVCHVLQYVAQLVKQISLAACIRALLSN